MRKGRSGGLRFCRWLVCGSLLALAGSVAAHEGGHGNELMWEVCESKPKDSACSYTNRVGDLYRGTCQIMVEHMVCVENQPVLRAGQSEQAQAAANEANGIAWMKWLPALLGLLALCAGLIFWLRQHRR